jgi:transposase-like protein
MVTCRRCDQPLERLHRHGFFERYVLNLVGVYPWRCRHCQITFYQETRNAAKSGDGNKL